MKKVKFATKVEAVVLKELRHFSKESGRPMADIVNEAITTHLENMRIRPAFRSAAARVLEKHAELLTRLAK